MDQEHLDKFVDLVVDRVAEAQRSEKDENEGNRGFVQIYEAHMSSFRAIIRENPTAAEIFYFLVEHMDRSNSVACSYTVLEELVDRKRTTIWKAIRFLKERNYIEVSKMGNCNVYHINANLAWKSYANGRKYAKFRATVILAQSEQEQVIQADSIRKLENQTE